MKLRPNAKFHVENSTIVEYYDPDGQPCPTWEEVMKIVNEDEKNTLLAENK